MIDHVVLAVPDLADGVAWFQRLTGVRPVMGGSHINLGTANYLVGLVRQPHLAP
jgi:catechol 2,3-dioxygenase-like lactoylglutathione lyase family enzyme